MNPTIRKTVLSIFTLILLLIGLTACSSSQSIEHKEPLKIGFSTWPGFDIIYYAQVKKIFQKHHLNVKLISYATQLEATQALQRLEIDAAMISIWDILNMKGNNNFDIILTTNVSHGADGIVSIEEISSFKALKNRKISAQSHSVNELILREALQKHNMHLQDVQTVNESNEDALAKLFHKEIEAAVLWEPLLSKAKKKINGHILFTTKEVNSLVIDTLIVQSDSIKKRPKDWQNFLFSWYDLMKDLKEKPEEVFTTVSKKINESSFERDYSGLQAGTIQLQREMFLNHRLINAIERIEKLIPHQSNEVKITINTPFVQTALEKWERQHP